MSNVMSWNEIQYAAEHMDRDELYDETCVINLLPYQLKLLEEMVPDEDRGFHRDIHNKIARAKIKIMIKAYREIPTCRLCHTLTTNILGNHSLERHHLKYGNDEVTIPLCWYCHQRVHRSNEEEYARFDPKRTDIENPHEIAQHLNERASLYADRKIYLYKALLNTRTLNRTENTRKSLKDDRKRPHTINFIDYFKTNDVIDVAGLSEWEEHTLKWMSLLFIYSEDKGTARPSFFLRFHIANEELYGRTLDESMKEYDKAYDKMFRYPKIPESDVEFEEGMTIDEMIDLCFQE